MGMCASVGGTQPSPRARIFTIRGGKDLSDMLFKPFVFTHWQFSKLVLKHFSPAPKQNKKILWSQLGSKVGCIR